MGKTIRFKTRNLHLDGGEICPAVVHCTPGEPLLIKPDGPADVTLDSTVHIALGRFDPHVHLRQAYVPTREEFEDDPYRAKDQDYDSLVAAVKTANAAYDVRRGVLAALKGGVVALGCMGNTPWGPVGLTRWEKTTALYRNASAIPIVVWARMEPGVPAVDGIEGKDFGSTFGGSGLTREARKEMFSHWSGRDISYHNDRARPDETIAQFRDRLAPKDYALHHLYFDGDMVLAEQEETLALAREAGIRRVLTRHIPTGSALEMLYKQRGKDLGLPLEVGLDYMFHNRDRLAQQDRDVAMINYRRPAHPSAEEQQKLITLTRALARIGTSDIFFGSDHAPHEEKNKQFKNGLPQSPGTRNLEHTTQILMHLLHSWEYLHSDIDALASVNPAKHMEPYLGLPYPVGTMSNGAFAGLTIFDPHTPYSASELDLRDQLSDPHYHTAMRGERLFGKTLFTIVNGRVYDVRGSPTELN